MGKSSSRDGVLLTTEELAQRWKMDAGTLENWRNEKKGPIFIKLGQGGSAPVRYRVCDIEKWEEKNAHGNKK